MIFKLSWIWALVCLHGAVTQFLDPQCGTSVQSSMKGRIIGGRQEAIGKSPWMAYLHFNMRLVCAGTLIHKRFVLTAAHCVIYGTALTVRLGEHDSSSLRDCTRDGCLPRHEEFGITMAFKHRWFTHVVNGYDIALLKLNRPVHYKVHIRPICLLLNPAEAPYSPFFKVTGWGKKDMWRDSKTLKAATLHQLMPYMCERTLNTVLYPSQICAGSPVADSCKGDSGGPLVWQLSYGKDIRTVQYGIVSYGSEPCRGPAVYTNVLSYTNWILELIRDYGN